MKDCTVVWVQEGRRMFFFNLGKTTEKNYIKPSGVTHFWFNNTGQQR